MAAARRASSTRLLRAAVSTEEFVDLDDVSVMHCFKLWQASDDPALAGLCRGLLFRRVYKTIDLTHAGDRDRHSGRRTRRPTPSPGREATPRTTCSTTSRRTRRTSRTAAAPAAAKQKSRCSGQTGR